MNFEYLVQKLQRILMSAGAVAFDLALKTLCEPCASTIKSLDALANQLNSMQIDECSAAQGLVATVVENPSARELGGKLSTALKENKISQGISGLFQSITESDRANQGVAQKPDVERAVSGCNTELKDIFISLAGAGQFSSLLHNLGVDKMGMPESYVNLIRGLAGDIYVESSDKAFTVSHVPPCPGNDPEDVTAFIDGNVLAKSRNGTCSVIGDSNRDLVLYVHNQMASIANRMKNKATPTSAEIAFIQSSPLAVVPTLRTAVATETEQAVIPVMSELTAKAHVVMMLGDLYSRSAHAMEKGREILSKKAVAQPGQDAENCLAELFTESAEREISGMLDRIHRLRSSARLSYHGSVEEANAILALMRDRQNLDNQLRREVAMRYGQDVARRVAGGD